MSNINPNNIDGTFPIQGQDNPSQGFRDNFTNIRNNFSYAQSELNDLQSKAITVSALSGGTLTNNMGYNQIQYAQLFSPSATWLATTPTPGSITIDYSKANFQKITTSGSYTINISNWPTSGQLGEMFLYVNVTSTSHTITFAGVTTGINEIAGANTATGAITFDQAPETFLFRLVSTDGGSTITINDLSRNYATLRDPSLYWNDEIVPTLLVGYGQNQTMFQTILALEGGQDAISTFGSHNSVAVGNLSIASINSPSVDTGQMGGYSVSATRGNLQTGTLTVSNSNDFLGYVNAITYTGTGVNQPQAFEQVSSIGFYATGSNTITGLGGNIAMFTHVPGATGNIVTQAVGIENDQSTKFFGNVVTANVFVPTNSATVGGKAGQISFDAGYIYICIAPGNWKRAALSTF